MDELIARLEAATEGSRELDKAIHAAATGQHLRTYKPRHRVLYWYQGDNCTIRREEKTPTYTTSLDAALTLVPDRESVVMERQYHPEGNCYACVWGPDGNRSVRARTLPLALCIAALKARSHTAPQEK